MIRYCTPLIRHTINSCYDILGNTVRLPASLQGKGKKSKNKKTMQLEPLAEFLLHTCKYIPAS